MSYTGRKAKRGRVSRFWQLDEEIRWLNYDPDHACIRNAIKADYEKEKKIIMDQIEEKTKELESISVVNHNLYKTN